jgi:hypothetical protein
MEYKCKVCAKDYSSYKSLWNHTKKFHTAKTAKDCITTVKQQDLTANNICKYCNKKFTRKNNMNVHINKSCKERKNEINKLKEELAIIKQETKETKEPIGSNITNNINNQLINIIIDKTKIIEKLKKTSKPLEIIKENRIEGKLILNDVIILSRVEDNYINATQLCKAGNKKFNDWVRLNSFVELINELECDTGIPASQLIDVKKGNSSEFIQGSWVHPDLAIQLAQWISPKFALMVSKWIRTLFTTGTVEINKELIDEIKIKDKKIKLLQDTYMKKHKRIEYIDRNVIYILTTEDHKKRRLYIIGKAINLKVRLGSYNKTQEHEVVYYKACKTEDDMNIIENMVLNKLKEYKEKANRDRFILPIDKDIKLFTDIIDKSIEFF